MRNILSIDQAKKAGYSILRNNKIISGGVWNLNKIKGRGAQLNYYYQTLMQIIKRERITEIVAEDIFLGANFKTFISLGEMRGVLLLAAADNNLPVTFISPKEHKEYLTNKKYATKEQTMSALDKLGYRYKDDNQADAISILLCHLNNKNIPVIHPISETRK